ncbi:hypothetical protein SO802_000703 [Lithocarpus litseifolius]|uniref:Uncharacterized protein n=1 Tax=Lithocarpus litseifolius TaxID=425828 RepID=A0AAW2DU30_9ROSI
MHNTYAATSSQYMLIKGGDEADVVCAAQEGLVVVHEDLEEEDDHVGEEVLDVGDLELVVGGEDLVVEGHAFSSSSSSFTRCGNW